MPIPVKGLVAALLLTAAGMAHAQTDASSPEAGKADTTTEPHQDWVLRCGSPMGTRLCEVTQEMNDRQSGKRVMAVGLRRDGAGNGAAMTIVAPLGIRLSSGIKLAAEGGPGGPLSLTLPFATCLPNGCIVQQSLSAAQVAAMAGSTALTAAFQTPDQKTLTVNLSPKGLGEAWSKAMADK